MRLYASNYLMQLYVHISSWLEMYILEINNYVR